MLKIITVSLWLILAVCFYDYWQFWVISYLAALQYLSNCAIILVLLIVPSMSHASEATCLQAIMQVESGGKDVVGDAGAAIGPYQIHYIYWKDSGVKGKYNQCHGKAYSEAVIKAYWKKYKCHSDEERCRVHNGGPNGMSKSATLGYWKKCKRYLNP